MAAGRLERRQRGFAGPGLTFRPRPVTLCGSRVPPGSRRRPYPGSPSCPRTIAVPCPQRGPGSLRVCEGDPMSRVCQGTRNKAMTGHHVSHANNKTKRRFEVNLQSKRFWLEEEKRWIRLRVSTSAMKTINKRGIGAVVREMRARGDKV